MEMTAAKPDIECRIAERLKALRTQRGWSLDELSARSGVSRASLSRLENAEVSPTAAMLGKLCAAHGLTLSRLMVLVEGGFVPLVPRHEQQEWTDPASGFTRRVVSPPAQDLAGEVIEGRLPAAAAVAYDRPPRPGLEHHLVVVEGELHLGVEGQVHVMRPGDCLRYRLTGASRFATPAGSGARYYLFLV